MTPKLGRHGSGLAPMIAMVRARENAAQVARAVGVVVDRGERLHGGPKRSAGLGSRREGS